MYRQIAVPVDATIESLRAVAVAVAIARRAGCPIELMRVAFPPTPGNELYALATLGSDEQEAMRRQADAELRRTAAEVEAAGVPAAVAVLEGDIAHTLAEHLEKRGADLVVMTTHDRGRLEHVLLGSVAESVVRRVHTPVLLVRVTAGDAPAASAPDIRRILIPLDGSPFGEEIIPHASVVARLMGAEITLLTVARPVVIAAALAADAGAPPSIELPSAIPMDDAHRDELESRALEETADKLRRQGLSVHTAVLADGNPARAIVEYARKNNIDLIAMTTHGRGALKRLVAGSVSETVLRTTATLMLMYRPDRHAPA
jgi:nucleotide-binding universal stress UspA family protein